MEFSGCTRGKFTGLEALDLLLGIRERGISQSEGGSAARCLVDLPLKSSGCRVELLESSAPLTHEAAGSLEPKEELVAGAAGG
jgi:hypothetical protein